MPIEVTPLFRELYLQAADHFEGFTTMGDKEVTGPEDVLSSLVQLTRARSMSGAGICALSCLAEASS